METRVLELIARRGKSEALCDAVEKEIRPRLRAIQGFLELVVLASEGEASLVVLMTVWRSRSAAARYDQEMCPEILQLLEPYVEGLLPEGAFQFAHDGGCLAQSAYPEEDYGTD